MKKFAKIRTSNFSAKPLRKSVLADRPVIVRLGSLTPTAKIFPTQRDIMEINTIEAIENSRNKLRMKDCFNNQKIPQAEWWTFDKEIKGSKLPYPIVIKRICGFQGRGMELIEDNDTFVNWMRTHRDLSGWFIEKFYNYAREYRLHVASGIGVFMSWRKLRTSAATERWFFNSANSVWVGPENELFDKPSCWNKLEKAATDCLTATGLDIGAVDIRVQSKNSHFIVCEINSAPALGNYGIEKYKEVIKQLIVNKNV